MKILKMSGNQKKIAIALGIVIVVGGLYYWNKQSKKLTTTTGGGTTTGGTTTGGGTTPLPSDPVKKYNGKRVFYSDANGKYIDGGIYLIQDGKKRLYSDWGLYLEKNPDDSIGVPSPDWDKLYALPYGINAN